MFVREYSTAQEEASDVQADNDNALLKRYLDGDMSAFSELVNIHQDRVLRFARHITGDLESAEDLIQEAWMRVTRHAHQFTEGRKFVPWFNRIIVNCHIDLCRARNRRLQPLLLSQGDETSSSSFSNNYTGNQIVDEEQNHEDTIDRLELLNLALNEIGESYRNALLNVTAGEASSESYGQDIGKAAATIRWQVHEGLEKMRNNRYMRLLNDRI